MDLTMELKLFSEPVDIDYNKHESHIKQWFKIFDNNIMWSRWNEDKFSYNGEWDYFTVHVNTLIEQNRIWALEIAQLELRLNGTFAILEFDYGPVRMCHTMNGKIAATLWNVSETFWNVSPIREFWNEHRKQQAGMNYVKSF